MNVPASLRGRCHMDRQYETVIGLEVHVELATKSKIFCGCAAAFGDAPNTHVCPVCAGLPGALPVLNKKVVEYAVAVGLATHCAIRRLCEFDRKHYFYPDNPQNYQISQRYLPICHDGYVEIETDGGTKRIGIREIHMEEDAGKLIHDARGDCSLVDFNRSGVPLLEIVSMPDMRSADETLAYLENLRLILRYLGVSDCKLQEGSMRVDVNLSVRTAGEAFGTRTEMKNLNSFRAIARAIAHERARQIGLLAAGQPVEQETRRWDDAKGTSFAMRAKESANDYRYFPDPDLAPVVVDDAWMRKIRARQPELRQEKLRRYQREYDIPDYDARILTSSKKMADLFEEASAICKKPKKVSNWLMGEALRLLKEAGKDAEDLQIAPEHLAGLVALVDAGDITGTVAKEVFAQMFARDIDPAAYVEAQGRKTVRDTGALASAIAQVLLDNPRAVADYRGGKEKTLGFLVGQTMRAMEGKADPAVVRRMLQDALRAPAHPSSGPS